MSFRNTLNSLLLFTVIFIVGFGLGDVAVLSMFLEGVVLAALYFAVGSLFGWLATLLVEVKALSWSSFWFGRSLVSAPLTTGRRSA